MRKSKAKRSKKEEVKVKSTVGKKEKKSKSKCDMSATSVGIKSPAPVGIKSESRPYPRQILFPWKLLENQQPCLAFHSKAGGLSGSHQLHLVVAAVAASAKSPSQNLHLNLFQLARVKSLHPSATSSQAW